MIVNDAHCHFFSTQFFAGLGRGLAGVGANTTGAQAKTTGARAETAEELAGVALARLGWEAPGTPQQLADRWVGELDRHHVSRAVLIASAPPDADSVGAACSRHPTRLVGFFMVDPTEADANNLAARAIERHHFRGICLFPAMHRYSLTDERVRNIFEVAVAHPGLAVFVHCGVLSVGVRKKLGLPSPFDIRFGNPLDLHAAALAFPSVPVLIPHFGAGLFREALMLADMCPNVVLDTSSSNGWRKYQTSSMTLADVFARALDVLGPARLLFGTDSSFFPRGWVKDVFEQQTAALDQLGSSADAREQIFGGNFDRLFP